MMTLKQLRVGANATVKEIAEHLKVDAGTIWRWESGKSPIPAWALVELLVYYDVDVDPREIVLPLAGKRGPNDA